MMKQSRHSSRTCIKNAKETENGQFKVPAIMNEDKLKMSIRYESVEKLSEMIKTMRLSLQKLSKTSMMQLKKRILLLNHF